MTVKAQRPAADDLDHVLAHSEALWRNLAGARLFLTGGTGFFGPWLLEAILQARRRLGVALPATVLSRSPETFLAAYPWFRGEFDFLEGDVTSFAFPPGAFTHVLHAAATPARATFRGESPRSKFDTLVVGTRRVLEFAAERKVSQVWFTSSGSAYGVQPAGLPLLPEEFPGAPDTMNAGAALGHAKRAAEFLCAAAAFDHGFEVKIARCFSFVGPYLPLDIHYAIGNFIGNALAGEPIEVRGHGTARRSYLYTADLVIWLLTVFGKGENRRIYNVGSEDARTIAELAQVVADCAEPRGLVRFAPQPQPAPATAAPDLYVPSTRRARTELGLREWIPLDEGIRRTIRYHRSLGNFHGNRLQ